MNWKDEFSVGIHEIDEHHRALSDCITSLEEAVAGREGPSAVDCALDRLDNFARIHFAVEECLMRILEYPELVEHSYEHFRFSDDLKKLQEKALNAEVTQQSIAFIGTWLRDHVMTSDKQYALHFLKRMA